MLNNDKTRILEIKDAPFSWKEKDILTGAEKYLEDAFNLPLIEMTKLCFSNILIEDQQKIAQVWRYSTAAFHLRKVKIQTQQIDVNIQLKNKAAKIYELECQRILGAIFSLEDNFWRAFYKRQEEETDKILIAIDALYYAALSKKSIAYQLLIQSFREIFKGLYASGKNKNIHLENANRLLIDLPLAELKAWIRNHKTE